MIKNIFIFFILFYSNLSGLNAQVKQEWVVIYNSPGQGNDLASDNSGNIYVTGNKTNSGIITVKYNSSGQEMWSRVTDIQGAGIKIAVDLNQDIIVCGFEGLSNILVVIKYNSSGDTLWTRRYMRPEAASYVPLNMKVDFDGIIYITLTTSSGGIDDFTILKYLSNGELQWERNYSYNPIYHDTANEISLGIDNYFYVTGFSYYPNDLLGFVIKYSKISGDTVWSKLKENYIPASIILDKKGMIYTTGNKDGNYYSDKINPEGQSVWNQIYNDSGGISKKIGVDKNNNIYVAGYQYNKARISIIKYDSDGSLLWSRTQYGAPNTFCGLSALVVDETGNSYIGGSMSYLDGYRDYLTSKYNSAGELIWTMKYNSGGIEYNTLYSLAKDMFNNIIVTGSGNNRPNSYCTTVKYSQTVGINIISNEVPVSNYLEQNYPNPFNPTTKITYQLRNTNFVRIKVYDELGKEISTLLNTNQNPGSYSIDFNGEKLPSGIYFYKLEAGDFTSTRKMILLR